jgi:hypothetical protein
VIFDLLKKEEIKQIVDLQLNEVSKRLTERDLRLSVTEKAKDFISESSFDNHYGARPIKRFIQNNILNKLAKIMLDASIKINPENKNNSNSNFEFVVEIDVKEIKNKIKEDKDISKNKIEIKKELTVELKKVKKEKIVSPIQTKDLEFKILK